MTLVKSGPVGASLAESMLLESRRQRFAGNQQFEDMFDRFLDELGMAAGRAIVALESRQNN